MAYSSVGPEIEIRRIPSKITCTAKMKIQLSLVKIPLRGRKCYKSNLGKEKNENTRKRDNFCKRGVDCNAVPLLIARVSQLKVIVILCITEEGYNTHTHIHKNCILWEICVLYPHTGKPRNFRQAFSV